MLLPEFLTSDDTSDMWRVSDNFISCCRRWCRRHSSDPTRNHVQRSRYQSHHFANFANLWICWTRPKLTPNSSGSVRVFHVHGFGSSSTYFFLHVSSSSVRFPSLAPNTSTCMGFSRRNKIPRCRVAVHMLWEKGIRFRHLDYDQDRAQKLIRSSMSWHLSTRNISSKSMHVFFSNLAHR